MVCMRTEFRDSYNSDPHRQQEFLSRTANEKHPFGKFGWGNTQSLATTPRAKGIDVRAEMIKFYQRHYSAHLMKVTFGSAFCYFGAPCAFISIHILCWSESLIIVNCIWYG
jgi:secreted Zn-dependent insulinase-like peptidase